ncbi:MAG: HDIG domain-containing protein [Desulfobacteraceae bacterium]|nr:HDIG domain-containing protein [Desulfobacteraceae bacterium]
MDPLIVIETYYPKGSSLYKILVDHSHKVAQKSLEIAGNLAHLTPDLGFIEKAAMLHDIGIFMTRAESLGCKGKFAYICHGYLGRRLLDEHGLDPGFGLVAERHTGAGITLDNIIKGGLPLPKREMVPVSLEEKIICCADKYFSKIKENRDRILTPLLIADDLAKIDPGHAARFSQWAEELHL